MSAPPTGLDRALTYALDVIPAVTPEHLTRPTSCRGWDLGTLLRHATESLAALEEGFGSGRIGLAATPEGGPPADPAASFREAAGRLRGAWTSAGRRRLIAVAGCPQDAAVTATVGALEIAVHSWDISQACGQHRPIPAALAADLLVIAPLLVPEAGRHPLFAPALPVPPTAPPGDRLLAFLGRRRGNP
jgi:uncharacterized protein (TIGR03086 family)